MHKLMCRLKLEKKMMVYGVYTPMSLVVRKPVFGVSDQVPHKPGCRATQDGQRLEISYIERRGIYTIYLVKTKALISFAVTAKLVCVLVFAFAKNRFSHGAADIKFVLTEEANESKTR